MSAVTALKKPLPTRPAIDFQAHAESDASLMLRSGRAIGAIAALIANDDLNRAMGDEDSVLSPSSMSGLLEAVQLIAEQLAERGEELGELITGEEE